MNICLVLFFLTSLKDLFLTHTPEERLLLFSWGAVVTVLALYSLVLGNEPSLIVRFSIIIFLLVSAYYIYPRKIYIDIFLSLILLQALFVILLEAYLITEFTPSNYSPIRIYFRTMGWGDIYTFGGPLWKIQIRGNVLIPFAFFVSTIYLNGWRRVIAASIFLVATILAGNFAFILGIAAFSGLYLVGQMKTQDRLLGGLFLFVILCAVLAIPVQDYLLQTIQAKSATSNPVRIDQIVVLVDALTSSVRSTFFGTGLGHTVDVVTGWRNYKGDIYYELQSLFFLSQLGAFFFIFVLVNILTSFMFIKESYALIAYICYVFYALFNPYFLDTSHIVAIIVCVSLSKILRDRRSTSEAREYPVENLFNRRHLQS